MDGVTLNPVALQTLPQAKSRQAAVLPKPASSQPAGEVRPAADFDAKVAEQQRFAAVQQAARGVANVYIVSDSRFTIFKDSSGQYITRFTSLRDGRVTYIPEPDLIRLSGSKATQALSIKV